MPAMTDAALDTFRLLEEKHGSGTLEFEALANEALQHFPSECKSIAHLQQRVGAQLAGIVSGLLLYGVCNKEAADGILLAAMRGAFDTATES